MKSGAGDTIKVFIRVRPFNGKQQDSGQCVNYNSSMIELNDKQPDHRFSFDQIFGIKSTQEEIYEKVGHQVVESAFEGINGTVFAYGQTSSGKTYTCLGPDNEGRQKQGILPRMVHHIFSRIQDAPPHIEFRIKISMVEIYMQKIKDLFDQTKGDLKIRQKQGKGIYIQDVTEEYVASAAQTMNHIKTGISNRSVGHTNMNDTSSRSHMAFIITLYQNNLKDSSAKSGKIILVDLAGSQKVSKTGAEGKLLDEAKQINKSLSALGNVINALTQNKIAHIPYRDSKLTRLLQESLGGNSKTNLIINVSPSSLNDHETLSSLRFGYRAKEIKNKPKVNREYTVAELLFLLEKAEKRIQQLELAIKEMNNNPSDKKKKMEKKSTYGFIQNLLDSDNPLITGDEQPDDQDKNMSTSPSKFLKNSRKKFALQSASQSQYQEIALTTSSFKKLSEANKALQEDKSVLGEQISLLSIEKVELLRQLDILEEKYKTIEKDNKVLLHKITNISKENEKIMEKYIYENMQKEEMALKMHELNDKIQSYEEKIISIGSLPQNPSAKLFGSTQLNKKTKQMLNMVMKNKPSDESKLLEEKIQKEKQMIEEKDRKIDELSKKCKVLEQEIALFKQLQNAKEAFIKEKLQFSSEKQKVMMDLQNRIQKVLFLEEKLDQEKQKNKYYTELINSEESEKARKILSLQRHINEVSQNYYVLKGQQSSWVKDNKKIQQKVKLKNQRIVQLQKQILELKQSSEQMKLRIEQLEEQKNHDESRFELDYSIDSEMKRPPRIEKIIRGSYNGLQEPQLILDSQFSDF